MTPLLSAMPPGSPDDEPEFHSEAPTVPYLPRFESASRSFVRARIRLQARCNDLAEAYQRGYALDMEIAAGNMETATLALVGAADILLAERDDASATERATLYETRALSDMIARLFAECLADEVAHGRLREVLSRCAATIANKLDSVGRNPGCRVPAAAPVTTEATTLKRVP